METHEMLDRCINNDRIAWDEFVKRYRGIVRKAAYYRLYKTSVSGSMDDIDDIVQEVFLVLWKDDKLAGIRDPACLVGWLTVVTINMAASYRRKQRKIAMTTTPLDQKLSDDSDITLADTIPSTQPDPLGVLRLQEELTRLNRDLYALNENERIAVCLKFYDEKSQDDIARLMGVPSNTVASLVHRAKGKLRMSMAEGGDDYGKELIGVDR